MKILLLLCVTFIFLSGSCLSQNIQSPAIHLFKIRKNNKYGYIDSDGNIVIKPSYLSAGEFAAGLAPARETGDYGYIDKSGRFVIAPQFDYATPFSEGLALVFKDAHPFYINTAGEKILDCPFAFASPFRHGLAFVGTLSGHMGVINKAGKLVVDTLYEDITQFNEGLAVVTKAEEETGVVDSAGNMIVPLKHYPFIGNMHNGYFRVSLYKKEDSANTNGSKEGFLNRKGALLFSVGHEKFSLLFSNVCDGMIQVFLEGLPAPYTGKRAVGFLDTTGKPIVNDPNIEDATDFCNNRAFIQYRDKSCVIINTKGDVVSKRVYEDATGFHQGYAGVKTGGKWGVIDTNETFILNPAFEDIREIKDSLVFFKEGKKYGIITLDGHTIIKPVMDVYWGSFDNGVLECTIDEKDALINKRGKIIWQEEKNYQPGDKEDMNTDIVGPIAYSAGLDDSGNNIGKEHPFPPGQLSVTVDTNLKGTYTDYRNMCNGITVFVANRTNQAQSFVSCMSTIYMNVQALDKNGRWRDIEYTPGSFCGNAYFDVTLSPGRYWTFITPVYTGSFKTKLRIKLSYTDPDDNEDTEEPKKELTVYSNEYEGHINPGQLWHRRKDIQNYTPEVLIGPYNEHND